MGPHVVGDSGLIGTRVGIAVRRYSPWMDGLPTLSAPSNVDPVETVVQPSPRRNLLRPYLRLPIVLRVGVALAAMAQLGLMLAVAWAQWRRFALTTDFAQYSQAQWLIGHGHLNPFDTLTNSPLWRMQATYILWPIGLLWPITHSSFSLLVIQDLALAGCTWVAGTWVVEAVEHRLSGRQLAQAGVVAGLVVALAVNPFAFEAAFFDFHPEPIGALFLLLAARAMWRGRRVSPYVWAALALTTGAAGTLLTVGLGLGVAVFVPGRRRQGLAIFLGGLVWLGVIVALGMSQGTPLVTSYGYLAGVQNKTGISAVLAIGFGIVQHPSLALQVLWHRHQPIYQILRAGGVIGLVTGWGVGVVVFDVLANGLIGPSVFIAFMSGGFQNFTAVIFLAVGSALAVVWLLRQGRAGKALGVAVGIVALVNSLSLAFTTDPGLPASWLSVVTPSAQVALVHAESKIPTSWAVIASQGVVGRFGTHTSVFSYLVPCETLPLAQKNTAVIIAPGQGIESVPIASAVSAVDQLKQAHDPLLVHDGGIWVFRVQRSHIGEILQLGAGCSAAGT
jgi:hypothetical protein